MIKLIPFRNKLGAICLGLLFLLLVLPSFWKMLRFGTFTMHDFHIFRLYEFDKCVRDSVFPCRWAPDAGLGFGEPLFSFYPQVSYFVGELFALMGLSIINSNKLSFIFSLVGSAISMIWLLNFIWKDKFSSILGAMLYVYAPYRAVDVWVRGALPESTAFVFYPLIVLFFEKLIETRKPKFVALLSISVAALLLTHLLSFVMFFLCFSPWIIFRILQKKSKKIVLLLFLSFALGIGISMFQLLPIATEMKFIRLDETTKGYYDFRAHFTTLRQLFIKREWGYGGSVWGNDDNMSFAVGTLHWILALVALFFSIQTKSKNKSMVIAFVGIGLLALFLTHNKSTFIWKNISVLERIQFPWRFLSIAVFCFSIAGSWTVSLFKNKFVPTMLLIVIVISLNASYFKEDKWLSISDESFFSGGIWIEQISSALYDFWPNFGKSVPSAPADGPVVEKGNASILSFVKKSHSADLSVDVLSKDAIVSVPIAYFPGWSLIYNNQKKEIQTNPTLGNMQVNLPEGKHNLTFKFEETPVRSFGNIISLVSILVALSLFHPLLFFRAIRFLSPTSK